MSNTNMSARPADDILLGARGIGAWLGTTQRRTYTLIAQGAIPTFRLGGVVAARKSTLADYLDRVDPGNEAPPVRASA